MDLLTVFTIIIGVIGAIAAIIQVIQYFEQRRKKESTTINLPFIPLTSRNGTDNEQIASTGTILSNSELVGPFEYTREKIVAHVHNNYEPTYSNRISERFIELNNRKRSKGFEGYFPGRRFRSISPAEVKDGSLEIHLTPLNFAFVALMQDELSDSASKELVQREIAMAAKRLPKRLVSKDPHVNAYSYNLIGTEVCFITSDGFTLLRRRGKHVLNSRYKWDVSVSGYPTPDDVKDDRLDLAETIHREARNEIGEINADQRKIIFTGLHRHTLTGDIDILAFWPLEDTSERIKDLITEKHYNKKTRIFKTTKVAVEKYVWDTDNLLVEFDGPTILQALQAENVTLENFVTEALICLELTLLARKQSVLGINLPQTSFERNF